MSIELAGKVAVWITIVLWSAGGMFARMLDTREDVANLSVDVKHHMLQTGHPVGLERLDTVLSEQKELRRDGGGVYRLPGLAIQAAGQAHG